MELFGTFWTDLRKDTRTLEEWKKAVVATDGQIGSFLQFDPTGLEKPVNEGPLSGIPFAVKDNIAVKGFRLTCASRLLEKFVSPYTASAVKKLEEAGGIVVGKTNLDEFGMGSSTERSALKKTVNPFDRSRVPGGSSGGSAAAVAAGLVPFSLGTDTGGSVRQPAAFCGVYGLKPTYGAVSRFGLVAYASSLEAIGVISKKVNIARLVFSLMKGVDNNDNTSSDQSSLEGAAPGAFAAANKKGKITIAVPSECAGHGLSPEVKKTLEQTKSALAKLGYEIVSCSLPTLEYVVPSYYTIATAEASANLARFDGVRYGRRSPLSDNPEKLTILSRNEGLGDEVKLRILLGTFVLRSGYQDQYYLKAQKIRTAIRNDLSAVFAGAHAILMPVFPTLPFEFGDSGMSPLEQKKADIFTCTANLTGVPAISFPAGMESGLPVGMQLLAPPFCEDLLFDITEKFEQVFPAPDAPVRLT